MLLMNLLISVIREMGGLWKNWGKKEGRREGREEGREGERKDEES